jgi:sigma-E factor negative regulatory protein RseA
MSEQIREQISAFLDGELPPAESELLMKRLLRDPELRDSFGRYALIGEAMRGSRPMSLRRDFGAAVNSAIDAQAMPAETRAASGASRRWFRPLAGAAVAAGVAMVAIVGLQVRTGNVPATAGTSPQPTPQVRSASAAQPVVSGAPAFARNREEHSYITPPSNGDALNAIGGARLANYVIAHSQYSSALSQRDLMTDVIVDVDQPAADPVTSVVR